MSHQDDVYRTKCIRCGHWFSFVSDGITCEYCRSQDERVSEPAPRKHTPDESVYRDRTGALMSNAPPGVGKWYEYLALGRGRPRGQGPALPSRKDFGSEQAYCAALIGVAKNGGKILDPIPCRKCDGICFDGSSPRPCPECGGIGSRLCALCNDMAFHVDDGDDPYCGTCWTTIRKQTTTTNEEAA